MKFRIKEWIAENKIGYIIAIAGAFISTSTFIILHAQGDQEISILTISKYLIISLAVSLTGVTLVFFGSYLYEKYGYKVLFIPACTLIGISFIYDITQDKEENKQKSYKELKPVESFFLKAMKAEIPNYKVPENVIKDLLDNKEVYLKCFKQMRGTKGKYWLSSNSSEIASFFIVIEEFETNPTKYAGDEDTELENQINFMKMPKVELTLFLSLPDVIRYPIVDRLNNNIKIAREQTNQQ